MKKEDLRIGNIVKIIELDENSLPIEVLCRVSELKQDDCVVQIISESKYNNARLKRTYEGIMPADLTQEKMFDLGFKMNGMDYMTHNYGFLVDISSIPFTTYSDRVKLDYIHDIQNLYHSISKHELTFREKTPIQMT